MCASFHCTETVTVYLPAWKVAQLECLNVIASLSPSDSSAKYLLCTTAMSKAENELRPTQTSYAQLLAPPPPTLFGASYNSDGTACLTGSRS